MRVFHKIRETPESNKMIFKILYLKMIFAQQCGNTDFTEETGIVASPGSPGGKFLKNLLSKRLLVNDFALMSLLKFFLLFYIYS